MRSGVFFAAITPASRAAASTSPFSTFPARMRFTVAGSIRTKPVATATRSVFSLCPTSTIFMAAGLENSVFGHPAVGLDRRHAAGAGRSDRLPVHGVLHVPADED